MKLITINNNQYKIKIRFVWGFNPVSRTLKSKKIYSRKNFKADNY